MSEQERPDDNEQTSSSVLLKEGLGDEPLARWRRLGTDSISLGSSDSTNLVSFEKQSKRLAVPFSSLDYVLLDTRAKRHERDTEELTIAFGSHVVSIWGERLRSLQDAFCDRSIAAVRMAPASAALIEETAAVVRELDWVETKEGE